jgi:hypothetical protein
MSAASAPEDVSVLVPVSVVVSGQLSVVSCQLSAGAESILIEVSNTLFQKIERPPRSRLRRSFGRKKCQRSFVVSSLAISSVTR